MLGCLIQSALGVVFGGVCGAFTSVCCASRVPSSALATSGASLRPLAPSSQSLAIPPAWNQTVVFVHFESCTHTRILKLTR
jgi:hypothetical protein